MPKNAEKKLRNKVLGKVSFSFGKTKKMCKKCEMQLTHDDMGGMALRKGGSTPREKTSCNKSRLKFSIL